MKSSNRVTGFCGHCNKAVGEFLSRSEYQRGEAQFHHTGDVPCPHCKQATKFLPTPGYVFVPLHQPQGRRKP